MPLAVGARLEHYEILAPLGVGGMGEVYRASDTKLKREVAIKVLPDQFARDAGRLARFEREAQALASLNHSNIAAIYGLENIDSVHFLVMELVEGQTIAERLAAKHMEVGEALKVAVQIAEAVQAAHDKGIVHRDLKPANVKITPEGKVKVLDFGLAKAMGDPDFAVDPANSPTLTMGETRAGVVLGTAAYMSPEQASGQPVDKRADVWAFGVVLYEMLSGKKAFEGKTTSHILVKVIESDPDWAALPPLPEGVRGVIERCVQKDAGKRLRDIGDVALLLESSAAHRVVSGAEAPRRLKPAPLWLGVAAAVVVLGVLGFAYLRPMPEAAAPAVRFDIAQQNASLTSILSISPDGRKLAFVASGADNRTLLWVRSLETAEARPLEATVGISGRPFWSPDSRSLAFTTQGQLKRIDADGGSAQSLYSGNFSLGLGGFWTADNKIVFSVGGSPLMQISASGGTATAITKLANGQFAHIAPSLLPDGRYFVYGIPATDSAGIYLGSLDATPEAQPRTRLVADGLMPTYAASPDPGVGYVLFVRGGGLNGPTGIVNPGTLLAVRFDPKKSEIIGEPIPIAEDVSPIGFSASTNGVLVYRTGPATGLVEGGVAGSQGQLTWFDRNGKVMSTAGEPGFYSFGTKLSPDGTRVAVTRPDAKGNFDIWIMEFARGVSVRFTSDPAPDVAPVWSGDGSKITFVSYRPGGDANAALYQKDANGAGKEEMLIKVGERVALNEWSRDGRFLLYYNGGRTTGDVFAFVAAAQPKIVPLLNSMPFAERGGSFSPDGRWFAYSSNESGKFEVYVRAFDPSAVSANGGQFLVSTAGAQGAHWSHDGKEIFYQGLDGTINSVAVSTNPGFKAQAPQALFKVPVTSFWDVTSDGKKFLIPMPQGANSPTPYKVVLNWTSTLKK